MRRVQGIHGASDAVRSGVLEVAQLGLWLEHGLGCTDGTGRLGHAETPEEEQLVLADWAPRRSRQNR